MWTRSFSRLSSRLSQKHSRCLALGLKMNKAPVLTSLTDQQTDDHHTRGVLGPVMERNQRAPRAPGEAADPV